MMGMHNSLKDEMTHAQALYEKHAPGRREPAPNYKVGDMVWLNAKNINTERPSKKLDAKNLGPFKTSEKINSIAYRLELPESMKIHDVFHTSILHPAQMNPLQGQIQEAPPPVVTQREGEDGPEELYEMEDIWDSRLYRRNGDVQYKVKWRGSNADWRFWEMVLPGCDDIVQRFYEGYPGKPGPLSGYNFKAGMKKRDKRRRKQGPLEPHREAPAKPLDPPAPSNSPAPPALPSSTEAPENPVSRPLMDELIPPAPLDGGLPEPIPPDTVVQNDEEESRERGITHDRRERETYQEEIGDG